MDPDWLLNLDLLSFNALAASYDTMHTQERYEVAWLTALAFNDTAELQKQVNEVRKSDKKNGMTGDDLVAQIGGGM